MDPQTMAMLAQLFKEKGGNLSSLLGNIFSDPRRPYADAERAYDPWMDRASGAMQPFYDQGVDAMNPFKKRLDEMGDAPGFLNHMMDKYQESDWAKNMKENAQRAATNAASASGLIGSTPYLQASEKIAGDISREDMQNWLQNALGVNKDYMGGYDRMIGRGFDAARNMADIFGNRARDTAQLEYDKSRAGQQRTGGIVGSILDFFL